MTPAGENELSAMSNDPQRLIRVPIGAVSPLWGLFAGAAVSGAAWWWMTRWARPANLEAVFGSAEEAETEVETEAEALAAPVADAVEAAPAVAEAAIEPVIEDTPPPPVAEALIEAAPEVVGGEAAPISPVLEAVSPVAEAASVEAAAEPKPAPKPKKIAPKVD
jgi:hypothetical protein